MDLIEQQEVLSEWDRDAKTPIEMASIKDLAYLKMDVDEMRRALRTVWVLCVVSFICLVISLGFLAMRPAGLSQEDLKEVLQDDRSQKMEKLILELEKQNGHK